jgi:hypothetical protein
MVRAAATRVASGSIMDPHLWKEGDPLGPIGSEILFENEHIRVWKIDLAPKEHQPWHKHHLPYLIVPLGTSTCDMRFADGTLRKITDAPGEVKWRGDPGPVHELYNTGDTDSRTVLVEIKAGAAAG